MPICPTTVPRRCSSFASIQESIPGDSPRRSATASLSPLRMPRPFNGLGILKGERLAVALLRGESPGMDSWIEAKDEQRLGTVVGQIGIHIAINTHENGDYGK